MTFMRKANCLNVFKTEATGRAPVTHTRTLRTMEVTRCLNAVHQQVTDVILTEAPLLNRTSLQKYYTVLSRRPILKLFNIFKMCSYFCP